MSKRMRLPNGFGQISELKGRRLRQPFRAMVTIGFKETGRPISKVLSYHKTYNEAYMALMKYHENPYDLTDKMTVEDLYNKWSEQHYKKISKSRKYAYISAWNYCKSLYKISIKDLRVADIKNCIENSGKNYSTKSGMKMVLSMMYDYAMEYEFVSKNPARAFNLKNDHEVKNHLAFTEDEISILWDNLDVLGVREILITIYSGWRPSELMDLENINFEEEYMIGGSKTKAGKNRIVPIHPKILKLVKEYSESKRVKYKEYSRRFERAMIELKLNPDHKPHDGRKTFITLAKKYKVDEYAIKRIVGHSIDDITESVYTERPLDWLKEEIVKIP